VIAHHIRPRLRHDRDKFFQELQRRENHVRCAVPQPFESFGGKSRTRAPHVKGVSYISFNDLFRRAGRNFPGLDSADKEVFSPTTLAHWRGDSDPRAIELGFRAGWSARGQSHRVENLSSASGGWIAETIRRKPWAGIPQSDQQSLLLPFRPCPFQGMVKSAAGRNPRLRPTMAHASI